MSDADVRAAERVIVRHTPNGYGRDWEAPIGPEARIVEQDGGRYRMRVNDLPLWRVEVAAYAGHKAAREVLDWTPGNNGKLYGYTGLGLSYSVGPDVDLAPISDWLLGLDR